ncbi:transglutaminase family protein [Acinetobacter sp. MD2(2019)]|uniref:transglutaminase family protein n=1 Tax=Acinetobacter sp. MD2(2019) TaxID=2605273 RepID=UPI002D1F38CC|nr:transglutaminase family protein [Acinetobacter sp. MD2(2019)]MEB3752927.1 transglutaminase family protein [Acinetobacter sp. MD2(2019)]
MKLMVNHQTHYRYTQQASNSIQSIKMMPQNGQHQHVHSWDISVPGQCTLQKDAFHNVWMTSTQRYAYHHLTIMAQGIVEIDAKQHVANHSTALHPYIFMQPTVMTACSPDMLAFAYTYVKVKDLQHLQKLAQAILEYIPYMPKVTHVHSSAISVFQQHENGGVCQDHAHVMIAMCRAMGLAARYISGYLYVPEMTHLASHAWVEVYLNQTWYCFDVSNQLFSPSSHIYVAVGRDYYDVAPVRGIREQGGVESMSSIVQVLAC